MPKLLPSVEGKGVEAGRIANAMIELRFSSGF
jgi:hypothetical protein